MSDPRTIVVTGCTRGIGRAMVDGFIEAGHTVHGCGRAAETIAELAERYPAPHTFRVLDVTDPVAVASWAEEVLAAGSPPDLLIANAGVTAERKSFWELPIEAIRQVVDVNVLGVMHTVHAFLPAMIERGVGVIVGISSGWGRFASAGVVPYCASKFAVEGMMQALAKELPAGMAALPVSPGVIATDMLRKVNGGRASHSPTPEEWQRKAVPWLLALEAGHNGKPLTTP